MTTPLAKLTQIDDLREIWKHEARDFSKWLSEEENLKTLSDAIGIDIALPERESSVGDFSVDLFATEEGTGRKIVIENQLTDTNHDHLGKIITYAAGKAADVVVWIVKRARDEHRQAIGWLNQRTDENVGFFLVEIEVFKIDNSRPAPSFSVVERPNEWAKIMKSEESLSDTKRLQLDFWLAFREYASANPDFTSNFSLRKANPQHYFNLSIGRSECHISLTLLKQKRLIGVEVYIPNNKELFHRLQAQEKDIVQFIKCELQCIEADIACRILTQRDADIKNDPSAWNSLFDWYCKTAILFKKMMERFDF